MINYSFIIPHQNCPELLNRLLGTIPSRNDIEVIVVDDNSDDGKKPTVSRGDVKIIQLSASESKGAGRARNVGLDNANGKWLLFADSDDYYERDFIEVLDRYKDKNIDILYFGYSMIVNQNSKKVKFDSHLNAFEKSSKQVNDIRRLGLSSTNPWNKMYCHSFIDSICVRFEELPISNDAWFVNYSGAMAKCIATVSNKLYYYSIREEGITKRMRCIEDYYQAIRSDRNRNCLKMQYGCLDLISLPGINKSNIIRKYGRKTYFKLLFYKLLSDRYFLCAAVKSICKLKWPF